MWFSRATSTLIHCTLVVCACNLTIQWMIIIGVLGPLNFVFGPDKWSSHYGYTGDLFNNLSDHLCGCSVQSVVLTSCLVLRCQKLSWWVKITYRSDGQNHRSLHRCLLKSCCVSMVWLELETGISLFVNQSCIYYCHNCMHTTLP